MKYCPACDKPYATLEFLQAHLTKAVSEGEPNHIDIVDLEGWNEKPLQET